MLWSAGDEAGSAEEHVVTLDDSTLHYWALGAGHKMVKVRSHSLDLLGRAVV